MNRRLVPFLLVLGSLATVAGCGDHRLTVAGYARFDTGDAFEFPTDIRIDSGGNVTGTCQVTRSADGNHGVVVDLYSGGDAGNRSVTVMARDDGSPGSVSARLQTGTFQSIDGQCMVSVAYVDDGGSVTLDASDCQMSSSDPLLDAATAADLHLELHGCDVQ